MVNCYSTDGIVFCPNCGCNWDVKRVDGKTEPNEVLYKCWSCGNLFRNKVEEKEVNMNAIETASREPKPLIIMKALEGLKEEITKFEDLLATLEGLPLAKSAPLEKDTPSFKLIYMGLSDELKDCRDRIANLKKSFEELLLL